MLEQSFKISVKRHAKVNVKHSLNISVQAGLIAIGKKTQLKKKKKKKEKKKTKKP